MKLKNLFILSLVALFCLNTFGKEAKAPAKVKVQPKVSQTTVVTFDNDSMIAKDKTYYNPFYCFVRGLNNLVSSSAEIPRCMIYNSTETPWYGWATGFCEGVGLTVCRVGVGCLDVVTFGFLGNGKDLVGGFSMFTSKFPETPWDAVWIPEPPEKPAYETDSM